MKTKHNYSAYSTLDIFRYVADQIKKCKVPPDAVLRETPGAVIAGAKRALRSIGTVHEEELIFWNVDADWWKMTKVFKGGN